MSRWLRKSHEIVKSLGMHVFHLEEPVSGAEHKLQICIGHDSCPLCGHVIPKTNTGELAPYEYEKQELANLDHSHGNQDAYAKKHQVPVRKVVKR